MRRARTAAEKERTRIARALTRARNKERDERMNQVNEAVIDERLRVNLAIGRGKVIVIPTGFGPYILDGVTPQYDYITHPEGTQRGTFNQRTFAGCNDGTWARIMRDAGCARHPLFAATHG